VLKHLGLKRDPDRSSAAKTLSYGKRIGKIGSVDPEIIVLQAVVKKKKKREINASKIYSPVGKFAERAKTGLGSSSQDYVTVIQKI